MGLDIFFIENIRNALLAANEASGATAAAFAELMMLQPLASELVVITPTCLPADTTKLVAMRAYRAGYRAALVTMALAFGVSPSVLDNIAVVPTKEGDKCDG